MAGWTRGLVGVVMLLAGCVAPGSRPGEPGHGDRTGADAAVGAPPADGDAVRGADGDVARAGAGPAGVAEGAVPEAAAEAPAVPAGLTVREVRWPGRAGEGEARVLAVVADPEQTEVVVEAATVHPAGWRTSGPVARELGALAVINGGYFSAEWRPLGLVVSAGRRSKALVRQGAPVFAVVAGRPVLLPPGDLPGEGVSEAVQCGPWLVRAGRVTDLKESSPSRRSAVGLDADGRVVLAATVAGSLTLADFAAALRDLGCREATNLDGGSSTGFVVPGLVEADGWQPMPTHLALVPRAER